MYLLIQNSAFSNRVASLEDTTRTINLETGLTFVTKSTQSIIFGRGFGSLWEWYAYENTILGTSFETDDSLLYKQDGYTLYHPHSTFLEIFVELGIVGMLLFTIIIGIIFKELITDKNNSLKTYILLGIISTFPAMALDFYLLKNWKLSVIWWFFLLFALNYDKQDKEEARNK